MNILTPNDCTGCKLNSRTLDGGSEDKTFCSRLDMIRDVPFLTPCPEQCCQSTFKTLSDAWSDMPLWFYFVLLAFFGLLMATIFSVIA